MLFRSIATKTRFDPATSKRHFKFMMSDYVATVLMSAALPRIERFAPGVRLDVLSNDVDSTTDELASGSIDFLIVPEPYLTQDNPHERLFEDEFVCVAWKDNPLLTAANELCLESYLASGHIVAQFGTARGVMFDEWIVERMGLDRRVELVVMNFTSLFPSVVGTRRLATVHRRLAQFYARYLPIRILDLPLEAPRIAEAIQWHRHFDADPGVLWMRSTLQEVVRDMETALDTGMQPDLKGRPSRTSPRPISPNPPKRFLQS